MVDVQGGGTDLHPVRLRASLREEVTYNLWPQKIRMALLSGIQQMKSP